MAGWQQPAGWGAFAGPGRLAPTPKKNNAATFVLLNLMSSSRTLRSRVSISALPISIDSDPADVASRIPIASVEDYFQCRANDLSDKSEISTLFIRIKIWFNNLLFFSSVYLLDGMLPFIGMG